MFGLNRINVARNFVMTTLYMGLCFTTFCCSPSSEVCKEAEPACVGGVSAEHFLKYFVDTYQVVSERSEDVFTRSAQYSEYKGGQRFKVQTGVTTSGWLCHASSAYFGRVTDDDLMVFSKIIDDLRRGEAIEADRGYTRLFQLFEEAHKRLLTPASNKRGRKPKSYDDDKDPDDANFTLHENIKTAQLAHRRIIVEHWNAAIERWKLACSIPHDMNHIVTYVQWAIMLLAVLTDPPHPVTEGGDGEKEEENEEDEDNMEEEGENDA
jgi:hypothetical protein